MLLSLVRVILFIAFIVAATVACSYLIEAGGEIKLSFNGEEHRFAPIVGLTGIASFMIAVWVMFKLFGLLTALFKFFNGGETFVSRYFNRNRQRKGFESLADSMVALASGEGKIALQKAAKAERYFGHSELTQLISAQAAEMSGDTKHALKNFEKLLKNNRTRFVGVQGLMKQKLAEGDSDTALKLAEKAFALCPTHTSTLETLFTLQTEKQEWSGARKTLEAKIKAHMLPRDVGRRRESVLLLAEARRLLDDGKISLGKAAALQSNTLSPSLIPSAVLAAEMRVLDNNKRAASKVLKKAWSSIPHPDLARTFAHIEPDESPAVRLKRFNQLLRVRPDDPESRMSQAELLLSVEDFPGARRSIGSLAEDEPTARSLVIMAAIEKGEGADDVVVRGWLTKALSASRGPQWICDSCNKIHTTWAPKCDNCAGFDTMDWTTPPASDDLAVNPAILPLMTGLLDAVPDVLTHEETAK